ncbi:hypothetical protein P3L10_031652 [Capsicum annuum]
MSLGHPKDHLDYVLNLIPLRMVNCYSAAEIWLFILSLGHPKDHLDYVLNLIPLRKC